MNDLIARLAPLVNEQHTRLNREFPEPEERIVIAKFMADFYTNLSVMNERQHNFALEMVKETEELLDVIA